MAQVQRLTARDNISKDQALAKIKSQMPWEDKLHLADRVIDNRGSQEATRGQVGVSG
jgi:dephospho-CoA kinase